MPRPEVNIRQARREDLPAIVELFSQDDEDAYAPGSGGAETSDAGLNDAFEVIASDPNNQVFVAELADASRPVGLPRAGVVGTFQLTMIRQLNYGGGLVAQVESVFVHPNWRSNGIGTTSAQRPLRTLRSVGAPADRRGGSGASAAPTAATSARNHDRAAASRSRSCQ
jgi:GNAT superfamily N-acetyltransferase